jgi:hypothetical protein
MGVDEYCAQRLFINNRAACHMHGMGRRFRERGPRAPIIPRVAGAAVGVMSNEPLPPDSPLRALPNASSRRTRAP